MKFDKLECEVVVDVAVILVPRLNSFLRKSVGSRKINSLHIEQLRSTVDGEIRDHR
jgi:hypothetical protein